MRTGSTAKPKNFLIFRTFTPGRGPSLKMERCTTDMLATHGIGVGLGFTLILATKHSSKYSNVSESLGSNSAYTPGLPSRMHSPEGQRTRWVQVYLGIGNTSCCRCHIQIKRFTVSVTGWGRHKTGATVWTKHRAGLPGECR